MRRAAACVVIGMVALAGLLLVARPVVADDATATVPMATEAWYETASCAAPNGCGALAMVSPSAPTNPYPADTLHVGIAAGAETDRTYLSLDVGSLPPDVSITGGTLTIPLDTDPSHGSQSADSAHVDACLVNGPIAPARASLAPPPAVACDARAPAAYTADGGPARLVVDLGPLAGRWTGSAAALALLPAQAAIDGHESWHVVFSATNRASPPSPPANASLRYTAAAADSSFTSGSSADAAPFPTGAGPPALPLIGAFPPPAAPIEPATPVPAPAAAVAPPAEAPAPAPAALVSVSGGPYRYPLVWLVPLALLMGAGSIGRALTRDLRQPA